MSKSYAVVNVASEYQPSKVYPFFVGSLGIVALFPSIIVWLPIELPPFVLNETVYFSGIVSNTLNPLVPLGLSCVISILFVCANTIGTKIESIELNRKLEIGSFSATIKYDCFSIKDKSSLNGAEVKVTIDVV